MASSTEEQNWKQIHFYSGEEYPKHAPSRSIKGSKKLADLQKTNAAPHMVKLYK